MAPPGPTPSHPSPSASRWRWSYVLALAVMVVVASGQSQIAAPEGIGFDKVAHFSVFGLLATLVARSPGLPRLRYAIVLVSLFGIGDEFRQSFTPGRVVEFADWMADTAGAVTAVVLYAFWPAYRRLLETPLRLPRRPASSTALAGASATLDGNSRPASAPAA